MPDLLAGTVVTALDTPPTVSNSQAGLFTFNDLGYGIDADSGSYVDCGVAFSAPTTGRVIVSFRAQVSNNTAGQYTAMSFVIRTGSTVGSGTLILSAVDDRALVHSGTDTAQMGTSLLVTGLTPGTVYNVRLEHAVGGGIGTLLRRAVMIAPAS